MSSPRARIAALRGRVTPARAAFAGIFVVTLLSLLAVGATLPVLPQYVEGPLGEGDFAVGLVTGAFAATGLLFRPIGGHLADSRGRKPVVLVGAASSTIAGILYLLADSVGALVVARLFLGAGEGMIYTAGAAWVVDLAPPERRGSIIGIYGLSIWLGLSVGPPVGDALLNAFSFDVVWIFAAAAPLLAGLIAARIPEPVQVLRTARTGGLISREALGPGLALALAVVGFAALASFIVLHLDEREIGHGTTAFTAFAATVVAARLFASGLVDRFGGARVAATCGLIEAIGLATIAVAGSLAVTIAGAVAMGAAFSLLFPSLAVLVVQRVGEDRRGIAMGTFTAFFDVGFGLGAPLTGAAAAVGGYPAAFWVGSAAALAALALALVLAAREVAAAPEAQKSLA